MIKNKYYAGIGSRQTPPEILDLMTELAAALMNKGYTLRSGGAKGADSAFEKGTTYKEIFRSNDAQPWAFEEVKKHMPSDRSGFDDWKPYVKGLMARNMMQILGRDGNKPVEFVLCWAPSINYADSSSGGTGYAIRCALAHGISVYNMFETSTIQFVKEWLKSLRSKDKV